MGMKNSAMQAGYVAELVSHDLKGSNGGGKVTGLK
jgi:hypothetical protein